MAALPPVPISLPTPFPVGPVTVYLLPGPPPALIDAGPNTEEAWAALITGLGRAGVEPRDIRHILLTHGHSDHYGLARRLVETSAAQVVIHPADRRMVETHPDELLCWVGFLRRFLPETGLEPDWVQRFCDGIAGRQGYAAPVPIARDLHDGEVLSLGGLRLRVFHTPGHSPGHVCLLAPDQHLLFAADTILQRITPNPILQAFDDFFGHRFEALVEYVMSLQKLEGLPVRQVLPAHGETVSDLDGRIREIRARIRDRMAKLLACLGPETLTVVGLARRHFADLPPRELLLAIFDVIGHLDLLRREGAVTVRRDEDLLRVSAVRSAESG